MVWGWWASYLWVRTQKILILCQKSLSVPNFGRFDQSFLIHFSQPRFCHLLQHQGFQTSQFAWKSDKNWLQTVVFTKSCHFWPRLDKQISFQDNLKFSKFSLIMKEIVWHFKFFTVVSLDIGQNYQSDLVWREVDHYAPENLKVENFWICDFFSLDCSTLGISRNHNFYF